MMKTIKDNHVTDRTGEVYTENKMKLSWPIGPSVVYDENQTTQ